MSRSGSGPKHNPRPPARRSLGDARLSMLATPRPLTTRAEFAADIRREWSNALEATIAVGRRLNEAKAALPHGEYEAMVATDLPFSTSTARKLREIAAFVDEGQVPLDRLPEAMSTLYAIATLPDDTRQQALDAGTIHPAVTRGEVEALKVPAVTPAPAGVEGLLPPGLRRGPRTNVDSPNRTVKAATARIGAFQAPERARSCLSSGTFRSSPVA